MQIFILSAFKRKQQSLRQEPGNQPGEHLRHHRRVGDQHLRQQRRWEEVQGVLGARAKSRVTSIE